MARGRGGEDTEEVEIACQLVRTSESGKAYLIDDGTRREWVPVSQVELDEDDRGGTIAKMPQWLAKDKGFI